MSRTLVPISRARSYMSIPASSAQVANVCRIAHGPGALAEDLGGCLELALARPGRWPARGNRGLRAASPSCAASRRARPGRPVGGIGEDSAVTEGTHHDVVIEGTVWHPIEATEFARHLRRYIGEDRDVMQAATSLAETIGHQVEAGHGDPIVLTENDRKVASSVLTACRHCLDIPDAVDPLYQQLHASWRVAGLSAHGLRWGCPVALGGELAVP